MVATKPVYLRRIDADHHPTLPARRDCHVAADQERETPEHLLLSDAYRAGNQLSNPISKFLVVGHDAIVTKAARRRQDVGRRRPTCHVTMPA